MHSLRDRCFDMDGVWTEGSMLGQGLHVPWRFESFHRSLSLAPVPGRCQTPALLQRCQPTRAHCASSGGHACCLSSCELIPPMWGSAFGTSPGRGSSTSRRVLSFASPPREAPYSSPIRNPSLPPLALLRGCAWNPFMHDHRWLTCIQCLASFFLDMVVACSA
jgi:hypothetical protein